MSTTKEITIKVEQTDLTEIQLIEINRILKSAQAIRLSKKESIALDMDYADADTETEYYNAAYYITRQRNDRTSTFYAPKRNIEILAERNGITLDSSTEIVERPAVTPFFCGGF